MAAPSGQTEQTTAGESPTLAAPDDASSSAKSGDGETMEVVRKVFHYVSLAVAGLFFVEVRSCVLLTSSFVFFADLILTL